MIKIDREIFFDPITGNIRFDKDFDLPQDIPANINWPNDNQRNNKEFGFKNLTLALTMNCNMDCDYCWQSHGFEHDIRRETIDKWLDFFLDNEKNSPNKILYYGGEPLLRLDLIEYTSAQMHQICKERNIPIVQQHLFTNGILLDEKTVKTLKREGVFFVLSIDGNKYVNNIHRHSKDKSDYMEVVMRNISYLHKYGVDFGVCCTVSEVEFDVKTTVGFILEEINPSSIELNIRHDRDFCESTKMYQGEKLSHFVEAWTMISNCGVKNID